MRPTHKGALAVLAAAAFAAVPAAPASARIIEIGQTAQANPPSCPTNPCQAVSRTTGYQAKVTTQRGLMQAPADGKIVAWTITLGKPGPRQIRFFNENYGGASQAGISVLKTGTKLFGRVTGKSAIQNLRAVVRDDRPVPARPRAQCQEGLPDRADGPELGAGARARHGQRHLVAGEPPARRLPGAGPPVGAARPARPRAVPLPVPDRAADLHRHADHDAEAAEARAADRRVRLAVTRASAPA